jgi:hypothetical protein
MDQVFLEVIFLLIGGALEDELPMSDSGKSNMIVGAMLSRRKLASRIEIWLGGDDEPEFEWTNAVERGLEEGLNKKYKIWQYKSFGKAGSGLR